MWALSGYLFADLTARSAECVFACDSSLEGYAVMDTELDPDREWIHDTGLVHTSFAARVLRSCELLADGTTLTLAGDAASSRPSSA